MEKIITVKAFQAIDGDCIWIRYGENEMTNIIIDLGRIGTYKKTIRTVLDFCIKNNEYIDLLVITHTDSDHISGITALSSDQDKISLIKKVWFNSPYEKIYDRSSDNISFKEGRKIYQFFNDNKVHILSGISNKQESCWLSGAKITVLSPDDTNLEKCNEEWMKTDSIAAKLCDWKYDFEELNNKETSERDQSKTNRASIAFLFEYNDKRLLFLGDSLPQIVIDKLNDMGINEDNPIDINLVKLSHHGSIYNFSSKLLNIIECDKFLLSSNGKNLSKEVIAKIAVHNLMKSLKETKFYFNYGCECYEGLFSGYECNEYSFVCVYPLEAVNFIEIKFD